MARCYRGYSSISEATSAFSNWAAWASRCNSCPGSQHHNLGGGGYCGDYIGVRFDKLSYWDAKTEAIV